MGGAGKWVLPAIGVAGATMLAGPAGGAAATEAMAGGAAAGAAGAAGAGAAGAGTAAAAAGGAAAAGAGTGLLGAGTAGALGSGMYGIPLAEGAGSLIGAGGTVGTGLLGGSGAAGTLGSGLAGVSMPTAAETASPWYAGALDAAKSGNKAMQTYGKVNSAMGGDKQAAPMRPAVMPFQGQPEQQISPFSGQSQPTGNNFAELLRRQMANNGLLG